MANPKVVKLRQRLRERGRLEDQPCGLSVFFFTEIWAQQISDISGCDVTPYYTRCDVIHHVIHHVKWFFLNRHQIPFRMSLHKDVDNESDRVRQSSDSNV